MTSDILPSIVSGCLALVAGGIAIWGQFRISRRNQEFERLKLKEEKDRHLARYSEPLVRAAADLQSRLYNILALDFVDRFLVHGTRREQAYALSNTAFLLAQFFAWTEATRLEIQFIRLDADEQTKQLSDLQSRIYSLFQTDRFDPAFRVFAGEQRAIGERMLVESATGLKCMGYGEFLAKGDFREDELLQALHEDVAALKSTQARAAPRLVALQNALIELIDFLDPQHLRFPAAERSKYVPPAR
jgi:hypothetical protein